jgi:VCBS repeat-containing protein
VPTFNGTNGDDTINGLGGDDTINGGNGDDTINGGGGDDDIDGGNGDDDIDGGGGDDDIEGGNGDDDIEGGSGEDEIDGGNGNDTIDGGDDDDIIYGGNGSDDLNGGGGNDTLIGENGNDNLTGGAGDDIIDGNNGFDTAYFSGPIGEYSFFSAGGYLHVVHLGGAGADGHDQLKRVERLVFADRVINIGSGNNRPVATDDHVFINEDAGVYNSGAASVLSNDFDFDGDALAVTPGVFVGTYGTLTLNANGTYSYTLNANAQTLAQGQNVQDSFNYTVSDNDGSDTGALVFHIAGVNDAPVAVADTNAGDPVVESGVNPGNTPFPGDGSAAGNVLANDTDVDSGDTKTVSAVNGSAVNVGAAVAGTYGSVTIASNGSYTYTLNNSDPDTNALAQGASVNDVFSYTVQDANGATSTTTLTITITGTNDAPVAVADTNAGDPVVESGVNPGNTPFPGDPSAAGNVLANDTDVDTGDTKTVSAVNGSGGNVGAAVAGTYGSVTIASNGSYTYTLNNADPDTNALAQGASVNDVFSYTVQDANGATSTTTLTITVTGTNDGPVANADTDTTSENAAVLVDVLANDTDVDNGAVLTVTAASAPVGQGSALVVGNQVEFDPGADFDYLAAGESVDVVVSYDITDENGATDSSTITITVTGTNDAPTIDAGGTDADGAATELPNNDPNEGTFVHTDSGTIAFDDLDLSDTHSASFTPQGGGYLGSFTLDPVNQAGDSVGWDFSVSDADLDFLDEGETLVQTYTVEIDDGNGGTVTQDVTITLTGAGDGPQTEWYIDNSAVGSANLGTQADPYTSIAAFNAAQGTLGGPQVGHTVYLLAGTGTYSESDGINLLDDQILVGVADGMVRPTIVTTDGTNHGIELAQNNTVSGLDIGDTMGADISDSNGSVGNLTIFDVGSSGTGQIVDIDQGGTLNVTLNSAESTGSAGGAVDLANVGGSFTVSGATSITGAHSGGGIDITGASAAVSFAGGGTVSTGATTAVNYVGNSGSLSLGGGLDIVTTSGAGLNASGGGTVTATGAGNSVTSTTGVAVSIIGTDIGAADLTFESVSANGAAYGIRLDTTGAGSLNITGVGTTDGSGGTIQNITTRGIELINTAGVSIANMALTNANTVSGVSLDLDVSNSNAAIYMSNVAGASLSNVDINGAADSGIVGIDVSDFVMDNSTITLAGDGANESGIEFVNLSGDSSISNTDISFSETNSLDIVNTDVSLNLVLDNVTFRDTQTVSSGGPASANGEGGFQFRSFSSLAGAPVTNIDIIDSDFLRLRTQGIQIISEDDTVISADITSNLIDSEAAIGVGIDLAANDTSQFAFNVMNNIVQSRSGNAINVVALGGADIEGRINENNVTANASGIGIRVLVDGAGSTGIIEARDNDVTMGAGNNSSAIDAQARVGNARLDLTLDLNTLDSNPGALTGDINITAGSSLAGETAQVYANIIDNVILAGGPVNVLRLRTSDLDATSDPRIFLEGFVEGGPGLDDDAVATWNANGNSPLVTAANINVTQTAGATAPSAGVALVPDNPEPLMAAGLPFRPLGGDALGQDDLDSAIDAAIQRWAEAGASAEQLAAMRGASVAVAELAGLDLGLAAGDLVLIDSDAAGYGWSLDGGKEGGMDLLTVVMHELGHVAGLGDHYSADEGHDLMHGFLQEGESRLPGGVFETEAAASGVVVGQGGWQDALEMMPRYSDTPYL